MKLRILSFFVMFSLFACTHRQTVQSQPHKANKETFVLTAIVELAAIKDSPKLKTSLLNVIKAPGAVKSKDDKEPNFEFRFTDSANQTITSRYKQLYLTQVVEYVDDSGKLAKTEIPNKKLVVPIRVNYIPQMKKLAVFQMQKEDYELVATYELNIKK